MALGGSGAGGGGVAEKEGGKQDASTQPKYSGGDVRDDEHDWIPAAAQLIDRVSTHLKPLTGPFTESAPIFMSGFLLRGKFYSFIHLMIFLMEKKMREIPGCGASL